MKFPVMLSTHFSYAEAVTSETAARRGIDNTPSESTLVVMRETAEHMEIVRDILGGLPIHINSWFRNVQLNGAIGSLTSSQHVKGEAVDFVCPRFGTPTQVCKQLVKHRDKIKFDQLILEHTWVHISFSILNSKPRNQVLSLLANGYYANGLTDKLGNTLT